MLSLYFFSLRLLSSDVSQMLKSTLRCRGQECASSNNLIIGEVRT